MKERPILFSTPMVKAILTGNKTVTRRVVKNLDLIQDWGDGCQDEAPCYEDEYGGWNKTETRCPYGFPGDLLWVRETTCIAPKNWAPQDDTCIQDPDGDMRHIAYRADTSYEGRSDTMKDYNLKWTPSIRVPKWSARIWLKVVSVSVEYLNAITRGDIIKEGACTKFDQSFMEPWITLWDSINGIPKPGKPDISWNANPWVWVVEFERTDKPISTKE